LLVLAGLTALSACTLALHDAHAARLLLIALGLLEGTITNRHPGYRALTQEELAARISVRPYAPQRFYREAALSDGREASYSIGGEILRGRAHPQVAPLANLLGLATAYELRPHRRR